MKLLIALLPLLWLSCSPPDSEQESKLYFDLSGYFSEQVRKLYSDSLVVVKTSVINEKTEQHQMNWTDWGKEFALFTSSDINKPTMKGKYLADTIAVDSARQRVSYTATDASLRTRLIELRYIHGEIEEIHIVNHQSSFLTTSHEELYYHPMKSYVIKSDVKNRFFGNNQFSVLGQIVKKQKRYF